MWTVCRSGMGDQIVWLLPSVTILPISNIFNLLCRHCDKIVPPINQHDTNHSQHVTSHFNGKGIDIGSVGSVILSELYQIDLISKRQEMKESQKCVHAGLCAECGYRGYCIFGVICNKLQRDVLPHRLDCDLLIQIPHFPPHVSPRVPTCPANISTSYRWLPHNEIMAGIGIHHQLASNTIQSPVLGILGETFSRIFILVCVCWSGVVTNGSGERVINLERWRQVNWKEQGASQEQTPSFTVLRHLAAHLVTTRLYDPQQTFISSFTLRYKFKLSIC